MPKKIILCVSIISTLLCAKSPFGEPVYEEADVAIRVPDRCEIKDRDENDKYSIICPTLTVIKKSTSSAQVTTDSNTTDQNQTATINESNATAPEYSIKIKDFTIFKGKSELQPGVDFESGIFWAVRNVGDKISEETEHFTNYALYYEINGLIKKVPDEFTPLNYNRPLVFEEQKDRIIIKNTKAEEFIYTNGSVTSTLIIDSNATTPLSKEFKESLNQYLIGYRGECDGLLSESNISKLSTHKGCLELVKEETGVELLEIANKKREEIPYSDDELQKVFSLIEKNTVKYKHDEFYYKFSHELVKRAINSKNKTTCKEIYDIASDANFLFPNTAIRDVTSFYYGLDITDPDDPRMVCMSTLIPLFIGN